MIEQSVGNSAGPGPSPRQSQGEPLPPAACSQVADQRCRTSVFMSPNRSPKENASTPSCSSHEQDWMRNGARVGVAVLGGMFLRGEMGAAMAGAAMYPVWVEVAAMLNLPVGTDADLDVLSDDIDDAMDDSDYETAW